MTRTDITIRLPRWLQSELRRVRRLGLDPRDRMAAALRLAEINVRRGSGGPFAAIVVDEASGRVLSAGVNLVVRERISVAHAEIVALSLAQQSTRSFDLSEEGSLRRQLVTTAEPCAMCLGAIPWSGVRSLVTGARDKDIRGIGFDEGDKPRRWAQLLRARGIEVTTDVLRSEATAILGAYRDRGGSLYSPPGGGRAAGSR